MNRKCSICGKELERNVYLCYDCYQEKRYKYTRVLAYSREEDFTRVCDYLEGFTATDINEYLSSLSYTVIIKDYLPYFLAGDLDLLPMKDLADAPVLRKGAYGYPKTHIVKKGNEFSDLYVQVGSKHYISSTCFDPCLPSLEFDDIFTRPSPGKCLLCDTQLRSFEHYLCPFHYREYVNKDLYFKLDVKFGEIECLDAQYNHRNRKKR